MCREMAWSHRDDTISTPQICNLSTDFGNEASALARARCILGVDPSAQDVQILRQAKRLLLH